jgi:predicted nucleotide-binding protein (sugar kinase/HSP70/actin superfamily)
LAVRRRIDKNGIIMNEAVKHMAARVGIPRALSFYTYYPLWKTFLEKLGMEVVLSRPTNKEILAAGIKETVSDACIPIKLFHGHVLDLKERVDYLFIPRLVSADGISTFCPKFLGLPDMIRCSGLKLPPLIDVRFKVKRLVGGMFRFLGATAKNLSAGNLFTLIKGAGSALRQHRAYHSLLLGGLEPGLAMQALNEPDRAPAPRRAKKKLTVALLGYPYTIYDPFVSAGLYDKLSGLDVALVTPEQIPPRQMRRFSRVLPQNFFWHYSNRVAWSGLYLLRSSNQPVDGLIHVTAFGCGPDAMVDKLLELEAKQAKKPFLTLTIDEHTGEGGIRTRLEAFVDMLLARKERINAEGK